jgi:hypothetical protein
MPTTTVKLLTVREFIKASFVSVMKSPWGLAHEVSFHPLGRTCLLSKFFAWEIGRGSWKMAPRSLGQLQWIPYIWESSFPSNSNPTLIYPLSHMEPTYHINFNPTLPPIPTAPLPMTLIPCFSLDPSHSLLSISHGKVASGPIDAQLGTALPPAPWARPQDGLPPAPSGAAKGRDAAAPSGTTIRRDSSPTWGGATLRRKGRADLHCVGERISGACDSTTRGGTVALQRGAVSMVAAAQDESPPRPRDALPLPEISTAVWELWRLACRVDEGSRQEPLQVRVEGRKIRAPHHSGADKSWVGRVFFGFGTWK